MAAYKKIVGSPIKPTGGRPSGKLWDAGVGSQPKSVGNIKGGPHLTQGGGSDRFMGKQASGPKTVTEARGKHLA